jgi:hypothetical protein
MVIRTTSCSIRSRAASSTVTTARGAAPAPLSGEACLLGQPRQKGRRVASTPAAPQKLPSRVPSVSTTMPAKTGTAKLTTKMSP